MKAGIQESTVALTDDAVRDVDSRMAAKSVKSESGGFGENILWPHTLHGEGDWEDGGYRLLFGVWHSHQQCWVHRSMMSESLMSLSSLVWPEVRGFPQPPARRCQRPSSPQLQMFCESGARIALAMLA